MRQTFDFEVFSDSQERVKVLLCDIDRAAVHELEDRDEVGVPHPSQVDHHVLTGVAPAEPDVFSDHLLQLWGAGAQDELVGAHRVLVGGQGDVAQVGVISELEKGGTQVRLEVVPPEAEVLLPA